ncbi:hypothetical protein BCD48_24090 [Pseudofrankia sp. BMG5.36]|nr:hypothetical protein [Pseudofrankia sp. BMG5.36]OHV44805.1 hypothetical protein BCD48_24090 [Pseudofrankia sp. BMG5.36]
MGLHLSQIDEADELLTNDPLALLIGMVLDQRVSEGWSGTGRSVLVRLWSVSPDSVVDQEVAGGDLPGV